MKKWLSLLTLLLLLLAALTSIPGLPPGVDLRGRWLQIHLIVATPLAILIVAWIWFHQVRLDLVKASAWLAISTGLGLIVIPMVGLTGTESTHLKSEPRRSPIDPPLGTGPWLAVISRRRSARPLCSDGRSKKSDGIETLVRSGSVITNSDGIAHPPRRGNG